MEHIFTKFFDGEKFRYYFDGKPYRNSKRDFKYGCFAVTHDVGKTFPVSLGNNKQTTRNSMAHCYAHYCKLTVIEIQTQTQTK